MAALLAGIAFLNIDTYFGAQAQHPEVYASFSTDETLIARHMVEQRSRGHSLFVSRQYLFSLTSSLLAQSPRREVIRAPGGIPNRLHAGTARGVYLLEPREASVYRLLRTYYPDGVYQVVRPPGGGRVLYYSVVLESKQLERRQGLMEVITLSDGTAIETTQPTTARLRFPG